MSKQVIVVRKDLNMRKGKLAAQVAHASMQFILTDSMIHVWAFQKDLTPPQVEWLRSELKTKIVPYVNSEAELLDLIEKAHVVGLVVYPMYDHGLTEFKGVKTLTCAAFGPDLGENIDPVTGHLPLL